MEALENREYVQATLGLRAETAGVTTPVLLGWVQRRAHEVALELGWATAVAVTWQLSGALAEPVLRTRGWVNVRRFNRLRGQLYRNVIVPPAPPGVVVHTAITDRQARQAHEVLEIALANHWEHGPKPTDRFLAIERAAEGHDQFLWFLAAVDGQPAAAVIARRRPDQGRIGWIGTRTSRRGLGRLMLTTAMAELACRGCTQLSGGVISARPATTMRRTASPRTCAAEGSRCASASATVDFSAAIRRVITTTAGWPSTTQNA